MLFILYTQPLFNLVNKHAVNHHAFADDNQLYKISTLDAIHQVIETLQNCTTGFILLVVSMQQCWLQSAVRMYTAMLASVCCLYACSNAGFSLLSVCMQHCWLQSSVCMYAANVNAGFNLLFVCMQQCWLQSAVCMYAAMLASICCLYVCSSAGFSLLSVCMQQTIVLYQSDGHGSLATRGTPNNCILFPNVSLHFQPRCMSRVLYVPSGNTEHETKSELSLFFSRLFVSVST